AWVDGVQAWSSHWNTNPFTVSQNEGTGLISQGTEDWTDYEVSADVTIPLGASAGLAARIGGMRRYLALVVENDGFVRLIRANHDRTVLAEAPFNHDPDKAYSLRLRVNGTLVR